MKKSVLFIPVFLISMVFGGYVNAQESGKNHEIGFRTYNMNNFGFIYKKQKSVNTYSRLRFATGEFGISQIDPFSGSLSLGFAGGQEKRMPMSEKLHFTTGFELILNLSSSLSGSNFNFNLTPGIGAVLGVGYAAGDKFIIGVETIPTASFKIGYGSSNIRISNLNIQFASTYASLYVVYRFSN